MAGGRAGFLPDDEEAGGVGGAVLDEFFQQVETVHFRGERSAEGGGSMGGLIAGDLGGFGGGGNLDEFGVREIFLDPAAALAEDLRMGIEGLDLVAGDGGHQAVFDAEQDLGTDAQGGIDEQIQGVGDRALGGILDRHHAVIHPASGYLLEACIQDRATNTTRFLVIGEKTCPPTGHDRTSIMFAIRDCPGSLVKALQAFEQFHINMSKIESRPSKRKDWEYIFYVDLAGHCEDPKVAHAIEELARHCSLVKLLGSYPDSSE